MTTNRNAFDLSNSTLYLVGVCFSNALDRIGINSMRNSREAGVLLVDELHRHGFTLTRERPVLSLSLRLPAEDIDETAELPVFLRPQAD